MEPTSLLSQKRKKRGGHRAFAKKLMAQARNEFDSHTGTEAENCTLRQLHASLKDRLENLKKSDDEILDDDSSEDDIVREVEEAGDLAAEIHKVLIAIEQLLKTEEPPKAAQAQGSAPSAAISSAGHVHVRLPKVEVTKFTGKICEWQELIDCFESAIDKNVSLSDVDKFTYLRGYLEWFAKACIAGFSLTSANYNAALNLLKERYGKRPVIVQAHIDELMRLKPVVYARDTTQLRQLYDSVETHYRGLNALEMGEASYGAIVVPSILQKLPEPVRLAITRGANYNEWEVTDFLKALKGEVDLREEQQSQPQQKAEGQQDPRKP